MRVITAFFIVLAVMTLGAQAAFGQPVPRSAVSFIGGEAENAQGEEFGDDRLMSTVQEGRRGTAAEILQDVLSAVHRFVNRQPFRDDLTLLVAKIR